MGLVALLLGVSIPLRGKGLRKKLVQDKGLLSLVRFHPLAGKRFEKVKKDALEMIESTSSVSIPLRGKGLRKGSFFVLGLWNKAFPSPCGEKV